MGVEWLYGARRGPNAMIDAPASMRAWLSTSRPREPTSEGESRSVGIRDGAESPADWAVGGLWAGVEWLRAEEMVRTCALIAPASMGSAISSTSKDLDALLLHDEREGTAAPAGERATRHEKAVGGQVDRAGHAGGAIRGWDPVPGRQEAGRVDDPRCGRPTGRLCQGGRGSPWPPSPRDPREE